MERRLNIFEKHGAPFSVGMKESEENIIKQGRLCPKPSVTSVLFSLPFSLLVPDGFHIHRSDVGLVTEQNRFIFDSSRDKSFEVRINAIPYGHKIKAESTTVLLVFRHHSHFPANINQSVSGVFMGRGDRLGKLSHTEVVAVMPLVDIEDDYQWDMSLFSNLAIDAINRFVERYKIINRFYEDNMYYLPKLTPETVIEFTVFSDMSGVEINVHQHLESSRLIINVMPAADATILRESLQSLDSPSLIKTFDLQIKNNLALRDWRLAIIESAIMFESWIQPIIREHLLRKLGSKNKVNSVLSFKDTTGRTHPMPMGDILKSLIEKEFGFPFQHTEAYQDVTTHTISPRNKLVHGGYFESTRETAELAYHSSHAAIKLLEENLPM